MNVLYLYCHALRESSHGGIREAALEGLHRTGHAVDLPDLYGEGFNPVLGAEERRPHHDEARNQRGLEPCIAWLRAAAAVVVQFPTWCFGPPAMLKGFFDRLILPGVALDLSDPAHVRPSLHNIKKVAGIVTYGRPRWTALAMDDPPRKLVTRYLRWFVARRAPVAYHALYHLNVAGDDRRRRFLGSVRRAMERF